MVLKNKEIKNFSQLGFKENKLLKISRRQRELNDERKSWNFSNTTNRHKTTRLLTRNLWTNLFNKKLKDSIK
jgi:hypothetical protein